MFKSTDKIANGEFSATVSRLGGKHNAFTSYDYTAYFERVAKDRLKDVMEMEADRMVNLRLSDQEVATERQVIIEERRVAHRERSLQHPHRADVGRALSEPSLPHPHHRLDARDGQALARGRAGLLQALLRAQQRHRGRHRRRQSGARSRRLPRPPTAHCPPIRRSAGRACVRRSPSSARRAGWS